jgi:acyl-CoA dehydrogenase
MQAHGGMGLSQDTPLAGSFAYGRFVRLADGPDEVHMAQLAKWTIAAALRAGATA